MLKEKKMEAVFQTLNYHFSLKLRTIGRTISFKAILELNKNCIYFKFHGKPTSSRHGLRFLSN